MQAGEVDGGAIRSGRGELGGLKVVFAVLVAQLELREAEFLEQLFVPVQSLLFLEVMRAVIARAFVDGAVGTLLPAVEGAVAVRAPITGRAGRTMVASQLRQATTDFTAQLAGLTTIVAVEELRGCAAVGASAGAWQRADTASANRRQRSTMLALILSTQLLPVQGGRDRRWSGRLGEGSVGIDVEIAIVRMLLAEVVARLRLGLTPSEDLLQLFDKVLQILAGKFPAEPKYQAWYAAHGGESLGNLAGSLTSGFGKRDFTAFFTRRQLPPRKLQPECTQPSQLTIDPSSLRLQGGESRSASFSHEFNRIWA